MSEQIWIDVCGYDELLPERGVAALVGTEQVAVFRTHDGTVHAIGNFDPFSGAFVLSRGIVGSRGPVPTVASPMYKDVFDLRTGHCLADPSVRVPCYPVSCRDGRVRVAAHPMTDTAVGVDARSASERARVSEPVTVGARGDGAGS